jgi:hypothetical protein
MLEVAVIDEMRDFDLVGGIRKGLGKVLRCCKAGRAAVTRTKDTTRGHERSLQSSTLTGI